MSDTGSQQGLVPVAPQGQMEMVASTSGPGGPGQPSAPTYEQLLRFYSEQTRQPMQVDPRVLSYTDLHEYYKTFFDRPATPLPPMCRGAVRIQLLAGPSGYSTFALRFGGAVAREAAYC